MRYFGHFSRNLRENGLILIVLCSSEYCGHEKFAPSCSQDEVIVMTHAVYGRMRVGKCVARSRGHVGCSSDVLHVLDEKCSNKRSCTLDIIRLSVDERIQDTCNDLRRYLEVDYRCQKGKLHVIEYLYCEISGANLHVK